MAIEKKLDEYYQVALRKKVYATATILDPRFKAEYFRGRQDCVSVKRRFYQDAESYAKHSEKSTAEPPQENNLTWIDRLFKKSKLSLRVYIYIFGIYIRRSLKNIYRG
jgi:hypothetical protein